MTGSSEYENMPVWPDADTPCIGVCSTSLGDAMCMGCGRMMDEIDSWLFKSDQEKAAIWARIQQAGVGIRWSCSKNEQSNKTLKKTKL